MNGTQEQQAKTPHVLVVDDDAFFCRIVQRQLSQADFTSDCVHGGAELFDYLLRRSADLVILDYDLGEENGLQLCRQLRRASSVPVIILTGVDDDIAVVACLDAGADDYLVKPHNREHLLARLRALLRRSSTGRPPVAVATILRFGDIELEPGSRTLRQGQQQTQMSARECVLLQTLHAQHPSPLDREHASWMVLRHELKPGDRTIDLLISRLRKRLKRIASRVTVVTLRNQGYLLCEH